MPFTNNISWKNNQKEDNDHRRVCSHLSCGSRPGKTEKNLKAIRRYFQYLTISNSGLVVNRKSNPFHSTFETIAIPQNLLCGLINTFYIKLNHPSKTQFKRVWHRYFFALDADKLIDECTQFSHSCNSFKQIPNKLFKQSTSKIPRILGVKFFADILRKAGQSILVVKEVLSSFTTAAIVKNQKAETLKESLITLTNILRISTPVCERADEAPAFQSLSKCPVLNALDIIVQTSNT